MKYLLIALLFSTPAYADSYFGVDGSYAFSDNSQALGFYAGYSTGDKLTVGPEVSVSVIDSAELLKGPYAYQGSVSLVASYNIAGFAPYGEIGYEYTKFSGEHSDNMFTEVGVSYQYESIIPYVSYKMLGKKFNDGTISAGLRIQF